MKLTLFVGFIAILALIASVAADPDPFPEKCIETVFPAAGSTTPTYFIDHNLLKRQVIITQTIITSDPGTTFDPDVYARWGNPPDVNNYDFMDSSRDTTSYLDITPSPEQLAQDGLKLFINAYAYTGSGKIKLCYNTYDCLNQNCGGNGNTCNAETGECTCSGVWKGDHCEIETVTQTFGTTFEVSLAPKKTKAFIYNVPVEHTSGEIQFHILRDTSIAPDVLLRARHNTLPTDDEYDYELNHSGFVRTGDLRIAHPFGTGDWYFTLRSTATAGQPVKLSVQAELFKCPNDCSGQGDCVQNTAKTSWECKCKPEYATSPDCSFHAHPLTVNETSPVIVHGSGHTLFNFNVPQKVSDLNVELLFKYTNKEACEPNCPIVYIATTVSQETKASQDRFIARSSTPTPQQQSISIPDHDLKQGAYTVAIYNPSYSAYSGSIGIVFVPHCPNNCSGHGYCNWDGHCLCHDGFHSSDCSITAKICEEKLPAKSGFGGGAIALTLFLALASGVIAGIFAFKFSAKKRANRSTHPNQQQLTADDQYSQLN